MSLKRRFWDYRRMIVKLHTHRLQSQHASRVIGDWIRFYNTQRPHQALGMKTPARAFELAA
jgi:putative transposase